MVINWSESDEKTLLLIRLDLERLREGAEDCRRAVTTASSPEVAELFRYELADYLEHIRVLEAKIADLESRMPLAPHK